VVLQPKAVTCGGVLPFTLIRHRPAVVLSWDSAVQCHVQACAACKCCSVGCCLMSLLALLLYSCLSRM
jgi:hypothetical protein